MAIAEKEITGAKLPLDSLEIKGYRAFKELTIPKLARVNLITGKNNVGKSSLLEAFLLYGLRGSPDAFWQMLRERHRITDGMLNGEDLVHSIVRVFNGSSIAQSITGRARLSFRIYTIRRSALVVQLLWPQPDGDYPLAINTDFTQKSSSGGEKVPDRNLTFTANRITDPSTRVLFDTEGALRTVLVGSHGIASSLLGSLWDKVDLTPFKAEVLLGLRIIAPTVQDIALRGDAGAGLGRVPYVRLETEDAPIPLSQMGDGMNRLFEILIALVNSSNGICLLDEIENGLHYSVLTDVWKMIFELAHRLNVQVFATTHSWECIQAFQKALAADKAEDGALVRLENKSGKNVATVFDGDDLETVTESWIEIR